MGSFRALLTTTCLTAALIGIAVTVAHANPEDGVVTSGAAIISSSGNKVDIYQHSDKAFIDWRTFDIAPDEHTQFYQPSSRSLAINRVNSDAPSYIEGKLTANGNIIIINQNGLMFGSGATVDVNSLVATTADINENQFDISEKLIFNKAGNPDASIINAGRISAKEAGLVGLVAPNVLNSGIIEAKMGRVQLASGDTMTIDFYGDDLLQVAVSDNVKSQLVMNTGSINADGGKIALTASAGKDIVNSLVVSKGTLEARSVGVKNGQIVISAEGRNAVKGNVSANKNTKQGSSTIIVQGTLDVSGRNAEERGGKIEVTGDHVALMNGTLIDASGYEGKSGTTDRLEKSAYRDGSAGGDIRIGGDYLGQGDTATAEALYVDPDVLVLNDALYSGDAGRTIFWSDDTTEFYGSVYARALGGKDFDLETGHAIAGGNAGDGGFVETSGHNNLDAGGYVDLTSSNGNRGTYFLDPANITIYGNFDPTFTSTDGTIDLGSKVQIWLDASDKSKVILDYHSLGTLAGGTAGSHTLTVNANTNLVIGGRIRLGAAGSSTTASTLGNDTYTITAISGTTITVAEALTSAYSGASIYLGYIGALNDKSGQNNNATQTVAADKPVWLDNQQNALAVARFNGDNYFNAGDINSLDFNQNSLSVFSTYAQYVGGAYAVISKSLYGAMAGRWSMTGISGSTQGFFANLGGSDLLPEAAYTLGTTSFMGSVVDRAAGNITNYRDGSQIGASANFAPDTVTNFNTANYVLIGAYNNSIGTGEQPGFSLNGTLNETFAYNTALSADSRTLLSQYESAKWNMIPNAPGTGATEADKAMATNGYSVFTTRYLERLSQSADISLQATNNIAIDLKGDTLNLATANRNITLTAGNLITTKSTGSIQTNGGNITLTGTNGINLNHDFGLTSNNGNITLNNNLRLGGAGTFNAGTGTLTFAGTIDSVDSFSTAKTLVVGGGGGGAGGTGGGGGAGGLIYNSAYALTTGALQNVTVGNGGAGGATFTNGASGQNSVFGSITALGGGGGGMNQNDGVNGGSGGGSGHDINNAGLGTPGQGNDGAGANTTAPHYGAGGGGGAGQVGLTGTNFVGGKGGDGLAYDISGSSVYYAGGGGGGVYMGGTVGAGGLGGGAAGTQNATANTGGGGGGATDNTSNSGAGGSGVVIVRYKGSEDQVFITGNATSSKVGDDTVWTFTSGSGALTNLGYGCTDGGCNLTATAGNVVFGGDIGNKSALGDISVTSQNTMTLGNITAKTIFARTTGASSDLTIATTKTLTASDTGSAIRLVSGRNFRNLSGTGALSAASGNWLVYSSNPADDTVGSLNSNYILNNCTYGGACPALGSGNGLLYKVPPVAPPSTKPTTSTIPASVLYISQSTTTAPVSAISNDEQKKDFQLVWDDPTQRIYQAFRGLLTFDPLLAREIGLEDENL